MYVTKTYKPSEPHIQKDRTNKMKKKISPKKKTASIITSSTNLPILELDFNSDLVFSSNFHPSKNLFITGSATGHVKLFKYDAEQLEARSISKTSSITDHIKDTWVKGKIGSKSITFNDNDDDQLVSVGWQTKRHKGSCRSIVFDQSGDHILSGGLDKQIKMARSETGQVTQKIKLDSDFNISKILSPPSDKNFLIVGVENGDVLCYDTRDFSQGSIYKIKKVHDDSINCISHLSPKSDYQFITVGSTTLSKFDIRKEKIISTSEDQEDEVLSCCFTDQSNPKDLVCGMGDGIVTVWKPINEYQDQISRIRLAKNESVDCVIPAMDSDSKYVYAGSSNGVVSKLDVKAGKVIENRLHDSNDEVGILDLDYEYRLVTSGLEKLKIWSNRFDDHGSDDYDEENRTDSDDFVKASSDEEDSSYCSDDGIEVLAEKETGDEWTGFSDDENERSDVVAKQESDENGEDIKRIGTEVETVEYGTKSSDLRELVRARLKKRLGNLKSLEQGPDLKKAKTISQGDHLAVGQEQQEEKSNVEERFSSSSQSDSEFQGNEISDSDSDTHDVMNTSTKDEESEKVKYVPLHSIKDQLLAQLEDSDDEEVEGQSGIKSKPKRKLTRKEKNKLKKEKKMSTKQLKNHQTHEHGIRRFDDL